MKKSLLKIGVLALWMFAFGFLFNGTSVAQETTWEVSLTISSGVSQCLYATSLDLLSQEVKLNDPYLFSGDFGGAFSCVDYRGNLFGATGGWTFDIIVNDLSNGASSISSGNVSINHTGGVLDWDSSCKAGFSTGSTRTPISWNYQLIERTNGSDGVCRLTINTVSLKVDVPANQAPGVYSGTLTLTVPSF